MKFKNLWPLIVWRPHKETFKLSLLTDNCTTTHWCTKNHTNTCIFINSQSLPLNTSSLFSMLLNEDIVNIEKRSGICLLTSAVDEFSGIFLHPSITYIIHVRSAWIINGHLSGFWYWLNSNTLLSWEGIITLQKSIFWHTFPCNSHLLSVPKEWRKSRQQKLPCLDYILLNNADRFFTSR